MTATTSVPCMRFRPSHLRLTPLSPSGSRLIAHGPVTFRYPEPEAGWFLLPEDDPWHVVACRLYPRGRAALHGAAGMEITLAVPVSGAHRLAAAYLIGPVAIELWQPTPPGLEMVGGRPEWTYAVFPRLGRAVVELEQDRVLLAAESVRPNAWRFGFYPVRLDDGGKPGMLRTPVGAETDLMTLSTQLAPPGPSSL